MVAGRIVFLSLVFCSVVSLWGARARAAPLQFSIQGEVMKDSLGGAGHALFFSLTVPLDRAARAAGPPLMTDAAATETESAAKDTSQRAPRRSEGSAKRPLLTREIVRQTVLRSLRASGRTEAMRRLGSLSSRARGSAALPEVMLRGDRTTDDTLRLTPTLDDPYRYTQAGGVRLSLGARLTWRLDRAIFASEELAVQRLRIQQSQVDATRIRRTLTALFAWHRAVLRANDPGELPEDRAEARVAALEHAFLLDILTGGWFGEHVAVERVADDEP